MDEVSGSRGAVDSPGTQQRQEKIHRNEAHVSVWKVQLIKVKLIQTVHCNAQHPLQELERLENQSGVPLLELCHVPMLQQSAPGCVLLL